MTTEEQVAGLQKSVGRLRLWLGLLVVALVGLGVAWVATETADPALAQEAEKAGKPAQVIRATAFVLVDDKGRERGKLAMDEFGPILSLSDENGKKRAALRTSTGGPGLSLFDENGRSRIRLIVSKNEAMLDLVDENGVPRAMLYAAKDAILELSAEDGTTGAEMCVSKESRWLGVYGTGKNRAVLSVPKDGPGPMLSLWAQTGNPRAELSVLGDGPMLRLLNDYGKVRWSAP